MGRYRSNYRLSESFDDDISPNIEPGESLYRAASTPKQTLLDLKAGRVVFAKRINFRGLSLSDADKQLTVLLQSTHHTTCYILVHGRGLKSTNNMPKIKHLLQNCLNGHRQVIAYCNAKDKDGGSGAMYVMLSAYLRSK